MTTFGHIEPFSGVREDFELYIERLEQYLVANDLDAIALSEDESNQSDVNSRDAKRRAILLSVIGPQTYPLLHNIMSPEKPATKNLLRTCEEITWSFCAKAYRDSAMFQVPFPLSSHWRDDSRFCIGATEACRVV